MHDAVDKGARGGICCISLKYAAADNPYLTDTFDLSKPNLYTIYLYNNLYGTAMCEPLPVKDFDFLQDEQVTSFDFMSVPGNSPKAYNQEVNVEYSEELHDMHSDYSLCPESLVVSPEDLSPYTVSLTAK